MEEFSCYFLSSIPHFDDFDIFTENVFAGLKITPSQHIAQVPKNVDFCIGKETKVIIEKQDPIVLNVPVISVEVKSFVDATMMGEILYTSRKIKGANPGSKIILLTWVNALTDDRVIEAAYDMSLDEIIVMSTEKRKGNEPLKIKFTKEGLQKYFSVMEDAISVVTKDVNIPQIGTLLSHVRI